MSDLYLILHKVRGEPAFDIARQEWYGEEEGWMLNTTEQRCYPAWAEPLNMMCECDLSTDLPDDLPDFHFQPPPRQPGQIKLKAGALLDKLGLRKAQPKFQRRF